MLNRLFPHPLLSLTLTIVWILLANTVTVGHLILGGILGIIIPIMTSAYWPDRARLRNPIGIAEYTVVVLWDIVVANVEVAMIILFKPNDAIRSRWICVPLDLTAPEAITVLAGTITLTPGTLSATLSADGASLLVHCLHSDDPDAIRDAIKARYERRLKEIFR